MRIIVIVGRDMNQSATQRRLDENRHNGDNKAQLWIKSNTSKKSNLIELGKINKLTNYFLTTDLSTTSSYGAIARMFAHAPCVRELATIKRIAKERIVAIHRTIHELR
jgi:hypothetical protein